MKFVRQIQEWQLQRILNILSRMQDKLRLNVFAFDITQEGVEEIRLDGLYKFGRHKLMDGRLMDWYRDTWFKIPHTALSVVYPDHTIVVGVWSTNLEGTKALIAVELPEADEKPLLEYLKEMGEVYQNE